jgi:uncharacterized repeat protein (TIGR01451 family)
MRKQMALVWLKRLSHLSSRSVLLAGVALAAAIGPARPQTVLAQGPTLTCTAPNPALRPPAAHKYFMVVVDSSGSMTTALTTADSCGYHTGAGAGVSTRIDHARCAVNHIVSQFDGTVDFGISQYATVMTAGSPTCYQSSSYASYQGNSGAAGCGPMPAGPATRAGARILAPVAEVTSTQPSAVLRWIDNNCTNGTEIGTSGNTPINGALRDMKRYFQTGWTSPAGFPSYAYATPLIGNTCPGRSLNVLLVTDGEETCDLLADAVAAAQDLYANGVVVSGVNYKVKTYVVNFAGGNQAATDQIADAGGTGASYFATDEAQLLSAMQTIMASPADVFNGTDDDCNACADDGWSDLSLTGAASPAVATIDQEVTYTFVAHNAGPTDADAKVEVTSQPAAGILSLPLPSLVGPAEWSCSGGTCTNPDFPVGGTATFTLTGTIGASATDGSTPAYALEISPIQYVRDPVASGNTASASVTVDVRATPTITWSAPGDIVFGTALGASQLNAAASTAGTFTYTPEAGTQLAAGTHALLVDFTPDDTAEFTGASASVSINVVKAAPAVSVTGGTFTYDGSPHAATASATGVGGATLTPVTITYNGSSSAPVNAGTYSVLAEFAGDANYASATATASLTIAKAAPVVSWTVPSPITYGTALGGAQLGAAASAAGTWVYSPAAGTVLNAGSGQSLGVAFTPADGTNYNPATATVSIDVLKATPTVTVTGGTFAYDGSPRPSTASATGVGGVPLGPVTITYGGSPTPPVSAGTYAVAAAYAGDANYNAASATATLTIMVVNKPPVCTTAKASPSQLWPPDHDMQRLRILGVTDPDKDPVTVLIASIFQDEPTNTDGERDHAPDGRGIGTSTAYVRAERGGNKYRQGNGRVYHIAFTASDGRGGTCTGDVTAGVPHDAKRGLAIDDGPRYDSTVTMPQLPAHDEDNCSDDRHDHRPKKDGRGDDRDDRSGQKRGGGPSK